jgi:hypothetical protein
MAEIRAGGTHQVLWPRWYYATFEPDLVIHDQTGNVRGRDGEDMAATPRDFHDQSLCFTTGPTGTLAAPDTILLVSQNSAGE